MYVLFVCDIFKVYYFCKAIINNATFILYYLWVWIFICDIKTSLVYSVYILRYVLFKHYLYVTKNYILVFKFVT